MLIGPERDVGDGVVVCEQRDADQCLEWSEPGACPPAAPYCSFGRCAAQCIDECAAGERRCAGPGAVRECGQGDSDPCLDWLAPAACAAGEVGSQGACRTQCQSECATGARACLGEGTVSCGDRDDDGCLEWGPIVPCPAGESCSNGACAAGCADECTTAACDGLSYSVCGNYDLDTCTERSPGISCVPGDPCLVGSCSVDDGCGTTPKACASPPAAYCVDPATKRVYDAQGQCDASGECQYAPHDVPCPGCPSCDPCAGVTCTTPPAAVCTGATTLRTFSAPGTCTAGACDFPYADTTCPNGCEAGACASCARTQCADGGANCGVIPDGCSGTQDCGPCSAPLVCGGGGQRNVCGSCQIAPWAPGYPAMNCGTTYQYYCSNIGACLLDQVNCSTLTNCPGDPNDYFCPCGFVVSCETEDCVSGDGR